MKMKKWAVDKNKCLNNRDIKRFRDRFGYWCEPAGRWVCS